MIYEQPPTLSSGFGVLTTEDQGKTPIEILDVSWEEGEGMGG